MDDTISYAEKQAVLVQLRRKVLVFMETGRHSDARTIIRELAEYDIAASRALRADCVRAYGIDI